MSIIDRMAKLHDDHTLSGILKQTPNCFVMSRDLIDELYSDKSQERYPMFRGCLIIEVPGDNILITGFRENA